MVDLRSQIKARFLKLSTEELLDIYNKHDFDTYSDETFNIIEEELTQRKIVFTKHYQVINKELFVNAIIKKVPTETLARVYLSHDNNVLPEESFLNIETELALRGHPVVKKNRSYDNDESDQRGFVNNQETRSLNNINKRSRGSILPYIIIFTLIGSCVGLFVCPALPYVGRKLPFHAIITRGATLTGWSSVLRSEAEKANNYILLGAAAGLFIGIIIYLFSNTRSETNDVRVAEIENQNPVIINVGQSFQEVEIINGKPMKIINLQDKTVWIYRDLKITFIEGKVMDVS